MRSVRALPAGRGSGNEKGPRERALLLGIGGVEGDRTLDLGIANAALSQLSYHPTEEAGFYPRPVNRNNPDLSRGVRPPGGAHFRTPTGAPWQAKSQLRRA